MVTDHHYTDIEIDAFVRNWASTFDWNADRTPMMDALAMIRKMRTERDEARAAVKRLREAIQGLIEIARIAMPDTYFQSDSRLVAARAALRPTLKETK